MLLIFFLGGTERKHSEKNEKRKEKHEKGNESGEGKMLKERKEREGVESIKGRGEWMKLVLLFFSWIPPTWPGVGQGNPTPVLGLVGFSLDEENSLPSQTQ